MDRLIQLINNFDEPYLYPKDAEARNRILNTMTDMYQSILSDHYLKPKAYASGVFGASQLGRPAICLVWDYFFPPAEEDIRQPSFAQMNKWFGGHLHEIDVFMYLERLGYEVRWQHEIEVFGMIKGHPDFICTDPATGERFVVECKKMGDSRYKEVVKNGMRNHQQYMVQLALYCVALECGGLWVVSNTDTGEMTCITIKASERSMYQNLVTNALKVPTLIKSGKSFVEMLEYVAPPTPRQRKDGTYFIPPTMYSGKGQLHPACALYDFQELEGKYYVNGYNYPQEAKQWEPEL